MTAWLQSHCCSTVAVGGGVEDPQRTCTASDNACSFVELQYKLSPPVQQRWQREELTREISESSTSLTLVFGD